MKRKIFALVLGTLLASGTAFAWPTGGWDSAFSSGSHASSHQNGGADEVATGTPAANAIPKAAAGGDLDVGWIPLAAPSAADTTHVPTSKQVYDFCETTQDYMKTADMPSDYTPSTHGTSHESGGSDTIKLDNLAAPEDNTDLNVSTSAHGLVPKLPNDATKFFDGSGAYDTVAFSELSGTPADYTPSTHGTSHEASGADEIKLDNLGSPEDNTDLNVSTSAHGLAPKLPNDATKFFDGSGAYDTVAFSELSGAPSDYTPSTHASSHVSGGSDSIKIDDLAAADDNTDLNVSTSAHGLAPKLSNNSATWLDGTGAYSAPTASEVGAATTSTKLDDFAAPDDNTDLNVSTSAHGLCPKLSNNAATWLDGTGAYSAPTAGEVGAATTSTKLDDFATPDDNTDLNVTTTYHGLCPKLPNDATKFLDGSGAYDTVAFSELSGAPSDYTPSTHASSHASGGSDAIKIDDLAAADDNTDLNVSTSAHGLMPKLSNSATEFLNGQGTWTEVAASVGGSYSLVTYTASGSISLTAGTDAMYQRIDPNGAVRNITLVDDAISPGDRFIITNTGTHDSAYYLKIYQDATNFDSIYPQSTREYVFDGTYWQGTATGSTRDGTGKYITAIGFETAAYDEGTSVGWNAISYTDGAAFGKGASGYSSGAAFGHSASTVGGVAIGKSAASTSGGTIVGYGGSATSGTGIGKWSIANNTGSCSFGLSATNNSLDYTKVFGHQGKALRHGEFVISFEENSSYYIGVSYVAWLGYVAAAAEPAATEIYLQGNSGKRCLIPASSSASFTINAAARDSNGNVAEYTARGNINRDSSNNTTLEDVTVTTNFEDIAGWDLTITADDSNEALKVQFTGNDSDTDNYGLRISVLAQLVETRTSGL